MSARCQRGQAGEAHGHAHVGDRGVRGAEQIHRSPECQIVLSGDEVTKNEPVRRGDQPARWSSCVTPDSAGPRQSRPPSGGNDRTLRFGGVDGVATEVGAGRYPLAEPGGAIGAARHRTSHRCSTISGTISPVGSQNRSCPRPGTTTRRAPGMVAVIASPLPGVNIPSSSPCTTSVG